MNLKRICASLAAALLVAPPALLGQCIVPANGAVVKTTSYTAVAADTGKLIVMNCASPCTLTLPPTPQTPVWMIFVASIGAGVASVSPNGLQLDGNTATVPIPPGIGEGLSIWTDNSNYFASGVSQTFYVTGGGTAQAQTAGPVPGVAAYTDGLFLCYKPSSSNTATAPTLAVNGLAATPVTKTGGAALLIGDLASGVIACLVYNATTPRFELINPQFSKATRALGWAFGDLATGSALNTSEVGYVTVPFPCTIIGWHIMADAGTVTIKTARVNGGTALPTLGSNSISTSGVSLSSGTKVDSTTVTDFTSTAVAANDTLGFFITTVATAKQITFQLDCSQ